MNFANRTPIRIGMVGELFGKRYRVVGRVVMGTEERGQTYYWTEFNLVNLDGESADLVFEETDSGPEWRLFVLFEPQYPITAADAATKTLGDRLNLDGTDVQVTLVGRSRIYHIEREGAEGEEIGDVADYFNAEGNGSRIVVSWTGREVECYRGADISFESVRSAFNLSSEAAARVAQSITSAQSDSSSTFTTKILWAILLVALGILAYGVFGLRASSPSSRFIATAAPSLPLKPGATGTLNGITWQIRQHALVQMAEVGLQYERHEYQLAGPEGATALLIYGFNAGQKDWVLLTRVEPLESLTPQAAASKHFGETVNVDVVGATITSISETILLESESAESSVSGKGAILYGFTARSPASVLLARWDQSGINFYRGKGLPAKEVAAGFKL